MGIGNEIKGGRLGKNKRVQSVSFKVEMGRHSGVVFVMLNYVIYTHIDLIGTVINKGKVYVIANYLWQ